MCPKIARLSHVATLGQNLEPGVRTIVAFAAIGAQHLVRIMLRVDTYDVTGAQTPSGRLCLGSICHPIWQFGHLIRANYFRCHKRSLLDVVLWLTTYAAE